MKKKPIAIVTIVLVLLIICLLIFPISIGNFTNTALAEKYPALREGGLRDCERRNNGEIVNSNHTLRVLSPNETWRSPDMQAICDGREGVIIPYNVNTFAIGHYIETDIIDCNEVYWIQEITLGGDTYWGPFNSSGCISLLQGGMSWNDCINNIETKAREKVGIFKPAKDEPIDAVRIDSEGNYWIKTTDDMWYSNSSNFSNPWSIVKWSSSVIDEQPGGINYNPMRDLNESSCDAYI